ncbi:arylsulfatase [Brevundimonas sp.]|uniref:arylsulfatase n=1 Tax=Brevundimonas sp. TaxID=1871086 RepID=UPI0037843C1E
MSRTAPSRRTLLSTLGLAGVAGSTAGMAGPVEASTPHGQVEAAPAGAPNIIVVLLDDLGYSDLDCYGGEIGTPHIDAMAREGAQYTNFHTTGVCSATRVALLTGLNHHSAGMGWLADADNGTPGYRGDMTHAAPTIAEHFHARGWSTYHIGKWHVNSVKTDANLGDPANWPLQRGFDRAYWFHGHSSDYFRPAEFREGNSVIEIEARDDYYVTDDLTDRAIADIRRHQAMSPDTPFLMYLAHAAPHSPLQSRAEDMTAVRGRYDAGWDAVRRERLDRQKASGVAPSGAVLPERDANVPEWSTLPPEQQALHARYMEAYAGVVRRIDWNMGRLMKALKDLQLDENTIVAIMSDNGGSPDAGPNGSPNLLAGGAGGVTPTQAHAMIDEIGGRDTCVAYSTGWAMASCTPFRMYKHHTFGGGVADPLIVRWPKGVKAPGELRRQYLHVIDLIPTLMDAAGIVPLTTTPAGARAKPIEGLSVAATLSDPAAPTVRREQYFEMEGKRAYHADGWEIVSSRQYGQPLDVDRWELFDVSTDYNQTTDVSAEHPDKLSELDRKWWAAARHYQVLPMDLRTTAERYFTSMSEGGGRSRWDIVPPMERLLAHGAPALFGRSHVIEVRLAPGGVGDGVLVAYGNMFLGCALYVKDGRLIYEAQARPHRYAIEMSVALPKDARVIRLECRMRQRPFIGRLTLSVDDVVVGEIAERRLIFGRPYQGLEVGRNGGVPVSLAYSDAFPYQGRIEGVTVTLDTSVYSPEEQDSLRAMFSGRR